MLAIRVEFLRGVFEAGAADNPREPEWPPSAMRLYSALVSVADPGGDDDLLRALESGPRPVIHVVHRVHRSRRSAFVPTNAIVPTAHTTLVGRKGQERSWARTIPSKNEVWFVWDQSPLNGLQRRRLADLCRRIPYFGRSTSPAILQVRDDDPPEDLRALRPVTTHSNLVTEEVRSPMPGALDALRLAHDRKYHQGLPGHPWTVGRMVGYTDADVGHGTREPDVVSGIYRDLVVLRLAEQLDGRHTARLAGALRKAFMARGAGAVPAVHGHHAGNVRQCAFLGLPFVGYPDSDGHLLGLAVAVPDLAAPAEAALNSAMPRIGETMTLTAGRLGNLALHRVGPAEQASLPVSLRSYRWTRPSARWATALPMVHPRFPKSDAEAERSIRAAVEHAGLPQPETVMWRNAPFVAGGVRLRGQDARRRPDEHGSKPFVHVALRFGVEVEGPIVIGDMRHYGLGLCVPCDGGHLDEGA